MRHSAVAQTTSKLNGSFPGLRSAEADPERPFDVLESGPLTPVR